MYQARVRESVSGRTFLLAHGRVPRVREGAALTAAETGNIIFIPAEILRRRPVSSRV